MILDHLSRTSAYATLHPRLAAGFTWLSAQKWEQLADGRYDIAGDDVYATVDSGTTIELAQRRFESHRRYTDIQYVISGGERMGWMPGNELPISEQAGPDIWFHVQPTKPVNLVRLLPGYFTVFMPGEAHMPICQLDELPAPFRKCVIKVDCS